MYTYMIVIKWNGIQLNRQHLYYTLIYTHHNKHYTAIVYEMSLKFSYCYTYTVYTTATKKRCIRMAMRFRPVKYQLSIVYISHVGHKYRGKYTRGTALEH